MEIKSLKGVAVETVHRAFTEAFSDYEVQVGIPLEKFLEMMKTRDLKLEYSLGAFEDERLVSFIVCGYREIDGARYCYDGGTGTVGEFRRKGLGSALAGELIKDLKKRGIDYFVLEVLENNKPAIELYKKHGFAVTRRLECYECAKSSLATASAREFIVGEDKSKYENLECAKYLTFTPSWQNARTSILNSFDKYDFLSLARDGQIIGYGIVHKSAGDILQMGVLDEWKDRGLEKVIVGALAEKTGGEKLKALNIPENDYSGKKLKEMGFTNFISQFEMSLKL